MPMPWSVTAISTDVVVAARSSMVTVVSSLRVRDRVLHQVGHRGGELAVAAVDGQRRACPSTTTSMLLGGGGGAGAVDHLGDHPVDGDRLGVGQRLGALQPGQLEQLVDQPAEPGRLVLDALGEPAGGGHVLGGVGAGAASTWSSVASSSASASSCSAPIGVFSSWLTLATKSRRTRATRCASVTSAASTATKLPPSADRPQVDAERARRPPSRRGAGRARPRGGRRCGGPGRPGYG